MQPRLCIDSSQDPRSVWNAVIAKFGTPPQAWMAYLNGAYALAPQALQFLRDNECAVGAIYVPLRGATDLAGGYAAGTAAAQQAITAAEALGLPQQVLLFVDVEAGWCGAAGVDAAAAFLEGWAAAQRAGAYASAGGVYCNPLDTGFQTALQTARAHSQDALLMPLWSAAPEPGAPRPSRVGDQAPAGTPRLCFGNGKRISTSGAAWPWTATLWPRTLPGCGRRLRCRFRTFPQDAGALLTLLP